MPGATPVYGWEYPLGSDAPNVPARMLASLLDVEATVESIDDRVTSGEGAWTTYAPTWAASTTNPSIGNGTLTGAYRIVGKTVWVRINMTAGSTTNFGTGSWSFSLPPGVTARTVSGHSVWPLWVGQAVTRDVSASSYNTTVVPTIGSGTSTIGSIPSLSPTSPMTWATSDHLTLTVMFESA